MFLMREKNPAEDLMGLILSLNSSEKRYFRLYAGEGLQGGRGIYLALYDHLIAAGKWSEPDIRAAFPGKKFLKQLNVARVRLQELILEALRSYDAGQSYQLEFSRRLDEIDILFRRKHFSACRRAIRSALVRAQKLELPLQELSLLPWAMRLERQKSGDNLNARLAPFHTQNEVIAYKVSVEVRLLKVADAMTALLPQHAEKNHDAKAQADELLRSSILKTSMAAMAFDAKMMYHYIYSYHALVHGDHMAYCEQQGQLLKVWESCPARKEFEKDRYIRVLIGYVDSTLAVRDFEKSRKQIEKLERELKRSKRLEAREQARMLNLNLSLRMDTHAWKEAADMEQAIQECLENKAMTTPPLARVALLSNLLVAMLMNERWSAVLLWASRFEEEVGPQSAEQWRAMIRYARWIAWYEDYMHDELEAGTKPFLRDDAEAFPGKLATQFKALLKAGSIAEEMAAFSALYACAHEKETEEAALHLDFLQTWALARLEGNSLIAADAIRKG